MVLPEFLDYYTTALLWLRMIALKSKTYQKQTYIEDKVASMTAGLKLAIPEPLLVQLQILGITQPITQERFYPYFPSLPTEVINGFGGYYGPLNAQIHNLYEEIPCLGVLSEAVRHSVSNENPGPYPSSLATAELEPNQNLLSYRPLGYRDKLAKDFAFSSGITAECFREATPNTGLNLEFILGISGYLAKTKSFKVHTVDVATLVESGSLIQVLTTSTPEGAVVILEKTGEIEVSSIVLDGRIPRRIFHHVRSTTLQKAQRTLACTHMGMRK